MLLRRVARIYLKVDTKNTYAKYGETDYYGVGRTDISFETQSNTPVLYKEVRRFKIGGNHLYYFSGWKKAKFAISNTNKHYRNLTNTIISMEFWES